MPHVEVKAATLQKQTEVARRFFVTPIVQIDSANLTLTKEMVFNLYRPRISLALSLILRDQTTVFSLEASYPVHAPAASGENPKLSTGTSLGWGHFLPTFSSRPSCCLRRPYSHRLLHRSGEEHWQEDDKHSRDDCWLADDRYLPTRDMRWLRDDWPGDDRYLPARDKRWLKDDCWPADDRSWLKRDKPA